MGRCGALNQRAGSCELATTSASDRIDSVTSAPDEGCSATAGETGSDGENIIAGQQIHLKFAMTLPAGSEVTTNGVEPAGTVQGKSASLTWTLTETMRDATTTNS